jgi:hypothetical protein
LHIASQTLNNDLVKSGWTKILGNSLWRLKTSSSSSRKGRFYQGGFMDNTLRQFLRAADSQSLLHRPCVVLANGRLFRDTIASSTAHYFLWYEGSYRCRPFGRHGIAYAIPSNIRLGVDTANLCLRYSHRTVRTPTSSVPDTGRFLLLVTRMDWILYQQRRQRY